MKKSTSKTKLYPKLYLRMFKLWVYKFIYKIKISFKISIDRKIPEKNFNFRKWDYQKLFEDFENAFYSSKNERF